MLKIEPGLTAWKANSLLILAPCSHYCVKLILMNFNWPFFFQLRKVNQKILSSLHCAFFTARVRRYLCALDQEVLIKTEKMHQKSETEMKDLKPKEIAVPIKVKEKQHMKKEETEHVRAMECAEQAEPMNQTDKKMGPAEEPKENMSMEEVEAFVPSNEDPIGEAERAIKCAEQAEPVDQADKKMGPAEESKENMSVEEVEASVPLKEDPIEETEPGTMEEPKEAEMRAMPNATQIDEVSVQVSPGFW